MRGNGGLDKEDVKYAYKANQHHVMLHQMAPSTGLRKTVEGSLRLLDGSTDISVPLKLARVSDNDPCLSCCLMKKSSRSCEVVSHTVPGTSCYWLLHAESAI